MRNDGGKVKALNIRAWAAAGLGWQLSQLSVSLDSPRMPSPDPACHLLHLFSITHSWRHNLFWGAF